MRSPTFGSAPVPRALAALSVVLVAGCGGTPEPSAPQEPTGSGLAIADTHVHAIERAGPSGGIVLATHDGLWTVDGDQLSQVGPQIDLMGFAVLNESTYLASGHPGAGVDLAEPVGLIETTDAGQTWSALSREGESDFHLLDVNDTVTVGFDGTLRSSTDGQTWQDGATPEDLIDVALRPAGAELLVSTASGVQRSPDGGNRWEPVPSAPPLVLLDWADQDTVVGISDTGAVHVSTDGGATWQESEQLDSAIQAMSTQRTPEGDIELLIAGENDVQAVMID
ncbi:hypothetical protein K0651_13190 [Ornithinimicrobium sp. Arc0846-15]|nr:hypothetical protein [Ornithinimicrobium laminariae]